jgi:hypothetical protein
MLTLSWFTILVIISLIFIILLIVLWLIAQRSQDNPVDPNPLPGMWTKPVESGAGCFLYTFPAQEVDGIFIPGIPNLSSISTMTGSNTFPSCLSKNQIIAQEFVRTCNADNCLNISGAFVPRGTTDSFYSTNNCQNITACPGTVALLSFNYQIPEQPISNTFCLDGTSLTMQVCNPTLDSQIFVLLSSAQANLNTWTNPLGNLFQIVDRTSGNYLDLDVNATPSSVDFDTTYIGGCNSGISELIQPVIIQPLNLMVNEGFVWLFLASGTVISNGGTNITLPQQIVYVGNLDLNILNGQVTYSDMITYLSNVSAFLLYFAGPANTNLVGGVQINTFPIETCQVKAFTPQYLSYSQFNLVSSLAGCQGPDEANCLGF